MRIGDDQGAGVEIRMPAIEGPDPAGLPAWRWFIGSLSRHRLVGVRDTFDFSDATPARLVTARIDSRYLTPARPRRCLDWRSSTRGSEADTLVGAARRSRPGEGEPCP